MNDALDTVRKEEWQLLVKDGYNAFKGIRWLLYKHSENRTKKETRLINRLKKGNRRIHRAWVLKDEFELFRQYKSPAAAKKFLERRITTALKSRIESLRKFVRTIWKHFDNIITYIGNAVTNAKADGINRIIKQIKDRSSGYKVLDNFIDTIYPDPARKAWYHAMLKVPLYVFYAGIGKIHRGKAGFTQNLCSQLKSIINH